MNDQGKTLHSRIMFLKCFVAIYAKYVKILFETKFVSCTSKYQRLLHDFITHV